MNRLRTRLIASNIAVMLVTLAVMTVLLVLLLRAQPVASEPIIARLTAISRAVQQRDGAASLLLSARDERLTPALDQLASRSNVRILVAAENGAVRYDSLAVVEAGASLDLTIWPRRRPEEPLFQGTFQFEGDEWLFVGQRLNTLSGPAYFLLAEVRPQSSWREVLNIFGSALFRPILLAGLVGVGLALVLAWLGSRGIASALSGLRRAAQAVAAGNYHERAPVAGPDEVRDVAITFNHMTGQVQNAQQMQQDFLANISHDLRTPLTSIQGFSQAIIDGTSKDPVHHARIISDEAGRLNRMVGELLDLGRISAGRLNMRQSRVNVGLIAENVAERLSMRAAEAGVHLVRDVQPVPEITGDGDRLAQVVMNLLDNALKFTPQGGTVRVEVRPSGGGVQLAVSDTGQGIPVEELPRVFERFYQVDKSRGPQRGTGLGLAITSEIVQAHGGRIRADSRGPGTGTTFTVWLPG